VLAAKSALQWDFPGSAVAIPYEAFLDNGLLQNVCQYLEQASVESIKDFAAHTCKAGMEIVEDRNTKDPGLISSVLMAILDANGRRFAPALLRKRVRDDVLWNNAAIPWRRLPFWLVTRVAIQRHLQRRLCPAEASSGRARVEYKFFVCLLLSGLLDDVKVNTTPDRLSHLKAKLCRRLAKLDVEMETGSAEALTSYQFCKTQLEGRLEQAVAQADTSLHQRWESFKESTTRTILPLPRRAEPEALALSFNAGSIHYLKHVLARFRNGKFVPPTSQQHGGSKRKPPQSSEILEPYLKLAESESRLQHDYALLGEVAPSQPVLDIAADIRQYIGNVGDLYDFSVEQKVRLLQTSFRLRPANNFTEYYAPDCHGVMDASRFGDVREVSAFESIPPLVHSGEPRRPSSSKVGRYDTASEDPIVSAATHRQQLVLNDGIRLSARGLLRTEIFRRGTRGREASEAPGSNSS